MEKIPGRNEGLIHHVDREKGGEGEGPGQLMRGARGAVSEGKSEVNPLHTRGR